MATLYGTNWARLDAEACLRLGLVDETFGPFAAHAPADGVSISNGDTEVNSTTDRVACTPGAVLLQGKLISKTLGRAEDEIAARVSSGVREVLLVIDSDGGDIRPANRFIQKLEECKR
jgi:hypothetical protein